MPIRCAVRGCNNLAANEVILFDVYSDGAAFFQQDTTCPYLCLEHTSENEAGADSERRPRGTVKYPFTNKHRALGFTVYRPLEDEASIS